MLEFCETVDPSLTDYESDGVRHTKLSVSIFVMLIHVSIPSRHGQRFSMTLFLGRRVKRRDWEPLPWTPFRGELSSPCKLSCPQGLYQPSAVLCWTLRILYAHSQPVNPALLSTMYLFCEDDIFSGALHQRSQEQIPRIECKNPSK